MSIVMGHPQKMSNLSGATSLKETYSFTCISHQPTVIPQLGVGFHLFFHILIVECNYSIKHIKADLVVSEA